MSSKDLTDAAAIAKPKCLIKTENENIKPTTSNLSFGAIFIE